MHGTRSPGIEALSHAELVKTNGGAAAPVSASGATGAINLNVDEKDGANNDGEFNT